MIEGPLRPPVSDLTAPYQEGVRRGELRVQRCSETGRLVFPPRERSPFAPHAGLVWTAVSGRGTIWSFAVPHPPLLPWYAERAPYNVILVALDEDPSVRMVGNLVASEDGGIGDVDPATIEIGAPVRAVFCRLDDELVLARWMLA